MMTELSTTPQHKKQYTVPILTKYGAIRDLTKSGAKSTHESSHSKKSSDRTLKENITRISTHPLGIGLYLFDYKPEHRDALGCARQFGVMADEVETVMPQAVSTHPDGYKVVDYAMLGIDLTRH